MKATLWMAKIGIGLTLAADIFSFFQGYQRLSYAKVIFVRGAKTGIVGPHYKERLRNWP